MRLCAERYSICVESEGSEYSMNVALVQGGSVASVKSRSRELVLSLFLSILMDLLEGGYSTVGFIEAADSLQKFE